MNKLLLNFISLLSILPLTACQLSPNANIDFDNKSYINNFELIQENSTNDTRIKINSPKAIIDPTINNIEILDSSIEIINGLGDDVRIKSGYSNLNNSKNIISVYKDVHINILENNNSYIKTNSFNWDLNTSNINLNSPLSIYFNNTTIFSSNGFYDINLSVLKTYNNIFNTTIYNSNGKEKYQIEIISDIAKWVKSENSLEFISNNKQVESTIDFLRIK